MLERLRDVFGDIADKLRGVSPVIIHIAGVAANQGDWRKAAVMAGVEHACELISRGTHRAATEEEEQEIKDMWEAERAAAAAAIAAVNAITAPTPAVVVNEPAAITEAAAPPESAPADETDEDDENQPNPKGKKRK